jgi:osmotically-inducible protein OsmY
MKRYVQGLFILLFVSQLTSCIVSSAFTGAKLFYDRHNVYHKMRDHKLALIAKNLLAKDSQLAKSRIDVTTFNGDLLIAGQVPTLALKEKAQKQVGQIIGVRRFFNQLTVGPDISVGKKIKDTFITAKIRAKIIGNDNVNPHAFKVVTENGIVYLMGDVKKEQAQHVVAIARHTQGVKKVVRAFRYFNYLPPARA